MEDPELEHLTLMMQRRRAQTLRQIEVHPNGFWVEKRHRVRAAGYVLVDLSMTRGTYERIRPHMIYSSFGLTNPVRRNARQRE